MLQFFEIVLLPTACVKDRKRTNDYISLAIGIK